MPVPGQTLYILTCSCGGGGMGEESSLQTGDQVSTLYIFTTVKLNIINIVKSV